MHGGVARTYSLPSETPPKDYLDEALMDGVSREQATSTWEHYYGDGLPARGVERPYRWLIKRAKERANATARVERRTGAPVVQSKPRETTGEEAVASMYALERGAP